MFKVIFGYRVNLGRWDTLVKTKQNITLRALVDYSHQTILTKILILFQERMIKRKKKVKVRMYLLLSSLLKENSPNKLLTSVCESWKISMLWDSWWLLVTIQEQTCFHQSWLFIYKLLLNGVFNLLYLFPLSPFKLTFISLFYRLLT